jgi:hypothetical protein
MAVTVSSTEKTGGFLIFLLYEKDSASVIFDASNTFREKRVTHSIKVFRHNKQILQ